MKIFTANQLKLLACLFMLCDHIGYLLLPQQQWLRVIGRLAFPLFAAMLANGWLHTGDKKAYLLRLLIFGLLFQPLFGLCMSTTRWNIFITLLLGALSMVAVDLCEMQRLTWLSVVAALALSLLGDHINADYGWYGVLICFSAYLFRQQPSAFILSWMALSAAYCYNNGRWMQLWSLLSLPLLFLYNGQRGRGNKWFFYLFYCLHIPYLWLIGKYLL